MADRRDQQRRGSKRKADKSVSAETKAPRKDGAGEAAPPAETEQELRQQNVMLKQQSLETRQKYQELENEVQRKTEQQTQMAEEMARKEQQLLSQAREIEMLRMRLGLSPPPATTMSAHQDLQPHDQTGTEMPDYTSQPVTATDSDENEPVTS